MKRVLFTLCMVLSTILVVADEQFTIDKYTFRITSPSEVELVGADNSLSSANLSPTITYQDDTYNVTSIGNGAFYGCSKLTSVTIPNSVTSIGEWAFYGCKSLTSITIPSSVTSIEWGAFQKCKSLTSITINSNDIINDVRIISEIFGSQIKECIIGDSVTSIGNYAFHHCKSLTSITIPNSVTKIGVTTFYGCKSLTSVTINSNAIINNGRTDIFGSQVKEYIFGDSVTSIGEDAFRGCSKLTSVTIPNSVTSIGDWAFEGCKSLTSVKYTGTKEQWNKIKKSDWADNSYIQVVRCTDGEIIMSKPKES